MVWYGKKMLIKIVGGFKFFDHHFLEIPFLFDQKSLRVKIFGFPKSFGGVKKFILKFVS